MTDTFTPQAPLRPVQFKPGGKPSASDLPKVIANVTPVPGHTPTFSRLIFM
ncbi:Unknown protein sequence [Pseudomonas syringae pv. syringae]|jgi:hypothetical protein|nr:Unknown protein sequence [Pseudomonas syringae pv. syringae]